MFIGGLSALLLQSLHPLAMAAVAGHSGFRGDPWGRLQRTSTFLATTTYGTADSAQQAVDRVRAVHETVRGTTADGEEYRASDPRLLCWVHIAEVDMFLRAHQRYGARPLDDEGCDAYVADMARVATALGVPDPPVDRAGLAERLAAYRAELRATPEARSTARFLLLNRPSRCSPGCRTASSPPTRCPAARLGLPRAVAAPCAPGRGRLRTPPGHRGHLGHPLGPRPHPRHAGLTPSALTALPRSRGQSCRWGGTGGRDGTPQAPGRVTPPRPVPTRGASQGVGLRGSPCPDAGRPAQHNPPRPDTQAPVDPGQKGHSVLTPTDVTHGHGRTKWRFAII
ncbi:hypothetical protein GCM10023238_39850 [Streptomyces heliomycini]